MDRRLSRGKLVTEARNTVPGEILKIAVGFERSKNPRLHRVRRGTSQAARSFLSLRRDYDPWTQRQLCHRRGKNTRVVRPTTCCECGRKC